VYVGHTTQSLRSREDGARRPGCPEATGRWSVGVQRPDVKKSVATEVATDCLKQ